MQSLEGQNANPIEADGDRDNVLLGRTGKKAVLKRNFNFTSILGFSCLTLGTWQGAFLLLGVCLNNGGPAGTIYSFIFIWIGNLATFSSLAELASMAPTSGGQYHWVSILAPESSQKLLSYMTGWLTVAGWQAGLASASFICGSLIQGFIQLVNPNYTPELWHATLLLYFSVGVGIFTTTVFGSSLPMIESIMMVIYILGFFGVLISLVVLGPHGDAKDVFTLFINNGGWSSKTLSFFVGISGNAFAFLGADSTYHMSEEIHNAAIVVPKAIVWCIIINGVVGLSMYIAILFCLGNIDDVLNSGFVYPFIEILLQAFMSRAGAAVVVAVLIITILALVISVVAAASRMLWSFARDRGVPGWRAISRVNPKTSIPNLAILVTAIVSFLVGLISIGSPVAFNDVISLTVGALYGSYLIACGLLLWRRMNGSIRLPSDDAQISLRSDKTNLPGNSGNLVWGPWRIREPFGTLINAFACGYLLVTFIFSFFPPATPVTPSTMNYTCLLMGGAGIISGVYYVFWGHRTYKGPVVDIQIS